MCTLPEVIGSREADLSVDQVIDGGRILAADVDVNVEQRVSVHQ